MKKTKPPETIKPKSEYHLCALCVHHDLLKLWCSRYADRTNASIINKPNDCPSYAPKIEYIIYR